MKKPTLLKISAAAGLGASLVLTACFDTGAGAPAEAPAQESPARAATPTPADLTIEQARAIIAAERSGTARPELAKGRYILKEGEQAPTEGEAVLESTDGRYVKRNGEWVLEQPLAKTTITRYFDYGYVKHIKLIAGTSSGIGCPSGYVKIDADLNRRAGGRWIFACIQFTSNPAEALEYKDIRVWSQSTYGTGYGNMSPFSGNGDMNQGAAGDFIFGTYGGAASYCRATGVGIITDPLYTWEMQMDRVPLGWGHLRFGPVDINKGAGGDFIYMIIKYQRVNGPVNCVGTYDGYTDPNPEWYAWKGWNP